MDCGWPTESMLGGASASCRLGQGGLVSQVPRLGRGGQDSQFTPIGLNEYGGVVDGLFSADWRILPDCGQNTKVGCAVHYKVQRKRDLFRKGNSSRIGLNST